MIEMVPVGTAYQQLAEVQDEEREVKKARYLASREEYTTDANWCRVHEIHGGTLRFWVETDAEFATARKKILNDILEDRAEQLRATVQKGIDIADVLLHQDTAQKALETIQELMENAEKEETRLKAAQVFVAAGAQYLARLARVAERAVPIGGTMTYEERRRLTITKGA